MIKRKLPELTNSQISEAFGVAMPTVRTRLKEVEPARKSGNSRYYDLRSVILAFEKPSTDREQMDAKERKELAAAELQEEKVKRMRGESVEAAEVELLVSGMFKRLADAIKACEEMPMKRRRAICKQIRTEIERTGGEVEKCRFDFNKE